MKKSQSGAAHVSFLWVVFLIVIVLFLAVFVYVAWKEKDAIEQERLAARQEAVQERDKAFQAQESLINLSEFAGFRDEGTIGSTSSTENIKDKVDFLRGKYADHISADASSLERVINGLVDFNNKLKREVDDKAATLETEIRTRREAQDSLRTIEQSKNVRIQELEGQLNDEQQRTAMQRDEDNQRIDNLQSQLDDLSNRLREVEAQAELDKQLARKEVSTLNARILAQSKKLEVIKEPDAPDGRVIATSAESELVYIDIGGLHGLRRGTKFDVFRFGKGGELVRKGRVEVRSVEEDSSLCGILEELDRLDPIVSGDVIANPLYSKDMQRAFVLLGRFPSSMNRAFIAGRLEALGNTVEQTISSRTDFLVLGEKEQGEFSQELTESDEYKLADKLGVQIVKLNEIWDFIKF